MATLLNANLPSEDEDDQDFRPDAADGATRSAARKRPRRGQATADADAGALPPDPEAAAAAAAADQDDDAAAGPADRAKKAKVDALWHQLQGRSSAASKPPAPARALMQLEKQAKPGSKKPSKKPSHSSDMLWMRSLGLAPPAAAKPPPPSGQDAKPSTRPQPAPPAAAANASGQSGSPPPPAPADAAAAAPPPPPPDAAAAAAPDAAAAAAAAAPPPPPDAAAAAASDPPGAAAASRAALAAAALAAAREAAAKGVAASYGKVTVTETRTFAGKDIQVAVQVDRDSQAARAAAERQRVAASGLDAFLQEVEKKKKVTVLDKTKMDWQELKAGDADLEEELEAHRRSGTQYLDKQDFLKRAELREYEQERDKRLAADVRLRGRL